MNQVKYQTLLSIYLISRKKIILFFIGILISIISFMIIFCIEYTSFHYYWNDDFNFNSLIRAISYCLAVAIIEELLFRYLFLRKWIKDNKKVFTKKVIYLGVLSSLIFGFLHLDFSVFPKLQIYITLAGLSLFYATYQFRTTLISIGMHFSWNFIQGAVFPFEGSGSNIVSLLTINNDLNIKPEVNDFVLLSIAIQFLLIYFTSAMWKKTTYNIG